MLVVGIGPGGREHRTRRAAEAIAEAGVVVGYGPYVDAVADLVGDKRRVTSGMTREVDRCREALRLACAGETVALLSSGDAGIYGMAGLALELAEAEDFQTTIEVVPGVTAASTAAAALGAPLMLDFAVISLSDLLVPWEKIRARIAAVAAADLVVALYNPRSKRRVRQLEEAVALLRESRPDTTPVGVVTAAGAEEQSVVLTDLAHVLQQDIGMRSIVIVGNTSTRRIGPWMVTPRGYFDAAEGE